MAAAVTPTAMRIVFKSGDSYAPIKASEVRSHTAIILEELEDDVFNINNSFNRMRIDGRQGLFCVTKKADFIAVEKIMPARSGEAKGYGAGRYIPLVARHEEVKQLLAGKSNFFKL